jgi:hypothetical protein
MNQSKNKRRSSAQAGAWEKEVPLMSKSLVQSTENLDKRFV